MPRPTLGSRSRLEHDEEADAAVHASSMPPPWFVPEPSRPEYPATNATTDSQSPLRADPAESHRVSHSVDNGSVDRGNDHSDGLSWYREATSQGQREAVALQEAFYDRPSTSSLLGDEGVVNEHVSSQGPSFLEALVGHDFYQKKSQIATANDGMGSGLLNDGSVADEAIYGASYGAHEVSAYGRTSPMSLRELNESTMTTTTTTISQPVKDEENWSMVASQEVSRNVLETSVHSSVLPSVPSLNTSDECAHLQHKLPSSSDDRKHFDDEPIDDTSLNKHSNSEQISKLSTTYAFSATYAEKQPSLDEVDAAAADAVKSMASYLHSLDDIDVAVADNRRLAASIRPSMDEVDAVKTDTGRMVAGVRPSLGEVDAAAADAVKSMAEALRGFTPAQNFGGGNPRPSTESPEANSSYGRQQEIEALRVSSASLLPRKGQRSVAYGGGSFPEEGDIEDAGEQTAHDSLRALIGSPTAAHDSSMPAAENKSHRRSARGDVDEDAIGGGSGDEEDDESEEVSEEEYLRRVQDATLYGRLLPAAAAQNNALEQLGGDFEDSACDVDVHGSDRSKRSGKLKSSGSGGNDNTIDSHARDDSQINTVASSRDSLVDWSGLSKSRHFNTTADGAATTTTVTTKDSHRLSPVASSQNNTHYDEHNQGCKNLPDEIPIARFLEPLPLSGHDNTQLSGNGVASALPFDTLIDLLPTGDAPCILALDEDDEVIDNQKRPSINSKTASADESGENILGNESRPSLSYNALRQFVAEDFPSILIAAGLRPKGGGNSRRSRHEESGGNQQQERFQPRLATLIPNGPEAAAVLVGCIACGVCCPMNYSSTAAEAISELASLGASLVLALETPGDSSSSYHALSAASTCGLPVAFLAPCSYPHPRGLVVLSRVVPPPTSLTSSIPLHLPLSMASSWPFTQRHEVALVLHTSGTSGTRKRVPHTLDNVCVGAALVAKSWNLSPSDVCCNMMPLFHVGGIARNLMAPLLSGGAVVCLPAFDPHDFWRCLVQHGVTWYYAAPTMHHQIMTFCPQALHSKKSSSDSSCSRRSSSDSRSNSCSQKHASESCKSEVKSSNEVVKRHPGEQLRMVANAAGGLLPTLAESLKHTFPNAVVLPSYGMTECMPISTPPQSYQLDRPGTSGIAVGPEIAIFRTLEDDQEVNKIDESLDECNRHSNLAFDDDDENASVASSDYFGYANEADDAHCDDDDASSASSSRGKFNSKYVRSLGQSSKKGTMPSGLLNGSFIEENGKHDSLGNDVSVSGSLRMGIQIIESSTGVARTAGEQEDRDKTGDRRKTNVNSAVWPRRAKPLEIGRIAIRGSPLFKGYENDPEATAQVFILGQGWFDTGDLGCLDEQGYLYITGRSKEVINRGGELISPFEVEEIFQQHPAIQEVLAVGVPHERLQEVVGLVVVPKAHVPWPSDLGLLQRYASQRQLHPFKWPQAVIFMPQGLPRGPTGKLQRIDFAKRAQLPRLRDHNDDVNNNINGNINNNENISKGAGAFYSSSAANEPTDENNTEMAVLFEAEIPLLNGSSGHKVNSSSRGSSSGSLLSLSNINCCPIRYNLDSLVSATTAAMHHGIEPESSSNKTATSSAGAGEMSSSAVLLPESVKVWANYAIAAVLWHSADDNSQQVCLYLAPRSVQHLLSSSLPEQTTATEGDTTAAATSNSTGTTDSSSTGGIHEKTSVPSATASSDAPHGAATRESVLARFEALKAKKTKQSAPGASSVPVEGTAGSASAALLESTKGGGEVPAMTPTCAVLDSNAELCLLRHLASAVHAHLVPHHLIVLESPLPATTVDPIAAGDAAEGNATSSAVTVSKAANHSSSPLPDRGINSGNFARWAFSPTTLIPKASQSEPGTTSAPATTDTTTTTDHASSAPENTAAMKTRNGGNFTPIASAVSPGALVLATTTSTTKSKQFPRGSEYGDISTHLCLDLLALSPPPQVNERKRRAVFDAIPLHDTDPRENNAHGNKNNDGRIGVQARSKISESDYNKNVENFTSTPQIIEGEEDDSEAARKARAKKNFYADRDALLQKAKAQKQLEQEQDKMIDQEHQGNFSSEYGVDVEHPTMSNTRQAAASLQSSPPSQPLSGSSIAAMTTRESEVRAMVTKAWIEVLNLPRKMSRSSEDDSFFEDGICGIDEDFFEMGGSSMLAGRLMSRVRKLSNLPPGRNLNATTIFTHRTIRSIATAVYAALPPVPFPIDSFQEGPYEREHELQSLQQEPEQQEEQDEEQLRDNLTRVDQQNQLPRQKGQTKTLDSSKEGEAAATRGAAKNSSDGVGDLNSESALSFDLNHAAELNPCVMATQLFPLLFFGPFKRVLTWTVIVSLWVSFTRDVFEPLHVSFPRLLALFTALAVGKILVVGLLLPLLGLAGKWLVIGRYRPGCHAPWSFYYLRWWLVDQWLDCCGRGVFVFSPLGLRLYYRLAGCAVGLGCVISPQATIREFDLVKLGDGCAIDDALIRGFAVDRGSVIFKTVQVRTGASVGAKSPVAPGTSVPPYCQLGPLSSTYEGSVDFAQKCSDADPGLFLAPQTRRRLRHTIAAARMNECHRDSDSNKIARFSSIRNFSSFFSLKGSDTSYTRVSPHDTTTNEARKGNHGNNERNDGDGDDNDDDINYEDVNDIDDNVNVEDESNRRFVRGAYPNQCAIWPWKVCVGWPALCLVKSAGALPWLLIVLRMVARGSGAPDRPLQSFSDAAIWLSRPERAGFYLLTRIAAALFTPPLELATAVMLKHLLVGKIAPGPRPKNPHLWATFRLWLAQVLVPGGDLRGVTKLVGTHYETVSRLYRLLGAKIGQRVYWPGTGIRGLGGLFDLLEVGSDVTFGSRSIVMPGDAHSLDTVCIGAGAMVADRCVLLPGAHVGRLSTLGSGTLAPRGWELLPGGMAVGSRRGQPLVLVQGDANGAAADANTPTITPFGVAFYRGQHNNDKNNNEHKNHQHHHNDKSPQGAPSAPYHVYGEWQMGCVHVGAVLLGTLLRAATLPSALALAVYWVHSSSTDDNVRGNGGTSYYDNINYDNYDSSSSSTSNYDSSSGNYDESSNSSASGMHTDTRDILSQSLRKMSTARIFDQSSSSSSLHFSWHFLGSFFLALVLVSFLLAVVSLVIDVGAKWCLLGRRTIGPHPWDKDSYCQRWQVYLAVSSAIRGPILDRTRGSGWLNAYFRALGAKIGPRVLLYPTKGDPMMTEPDLVEIGAGACIDDASLICHLNARGHFALNPLVIGRGATMRSGSRLLSGAAMEPHASLLEHTMVLSGDVAPAHGTLQGWPADIYQPTAVPM